MNNLEHFHHLITWYLLGVIDERQELIDIFRNSRVILVALAPFLCVYIEFLFNIFLARFFFKLAPLRLNVPDVISTNRSSLAWNDESLKELQDFLDERFLIYGEQIQDLKGKIYKVSFKDYTDWDGGIGYEIDVIHYEILNMDMFHHYCQMHDFSELFYRGSLADGLKVNHWLVQNPWIKIMIEDFELDKSIQFLPWCKTQNLKFLLFD
jgi:hypothetical protein